MNRSLQTEITMDIEDFEAYKISAQTKISLNLLDLKKILTFAESVSAMLTAYLTAPGESYFC